MSYVEKEPCSPNSHQKPPSSLPASPSTPGQISPPAPASPKTSCSPPTASPSVAMSTPFKNDDLSYMEPETPAKLPEKTEHSDISDLDTDITAGLETDIIENQNSLLQKFNFE